MIYSYPQIYHFIMRLIYQKYFWQRYENILPFMGDRESILDICCGTGSLYFFLNSEQKKKYLGLEVSPRFIKYLAEKRIPAQKFDFLQSVLPVNYDNIVMLSSLYQLHPHCEKALVQMLQSAENKVILMEPILNHSSGQRPLVKKILNFLTRPQSQNKYTGFRFNEASLKAFMNPFLPWVQSSYPVCGGREMVYVLDARKWRKDQTWI